MAKNGKDLVQIVMRADKSIASMEELRAELRKVETPKLATGYLLVKDFANRVKKFTESVREVLLYADDVSAKKKVYNGRFFDEDVEADDRGSRFLVGEDGRKLKAERRLTPRMNGAVATKILDEKGLFADAADVQVVAQGPEVMTQLRSLRRELEDKELPDLVEKVSTIIDTFHVEETLNERKIEALIALEKLTVEEVEQMFDVAEVFALKEEKKR